MWTLKRGFLPSNDPIHALPISNIDNTHFIYALENLLTNLPSFHKDRCVREELVSQLRELAQFYYHGCIDSLGGANEYERVFLIFSFFSNSYIHAYGENMKPKVPKEISMPFMRAAHLVQRKPVLDYTSYCLYNWRKKGDGFEILCTFSDTEDERLMISTFLELEHIATEVFESKLNLVKINEVLAAAIKVFDSNWQKIDWDAFRAFARCHDAYEDILFENSGMPPQSYPGDILSQSPFIRLVYGVLGVSFSDERLANLEKSLLFLRPPTHTNFLNSIHPVRDEAFKDKKYAELYNDSLSLLLKLLGYVYCPVYDSGLSNNKRLEEVSAHFIDVQKTFC